MASSQPLQKANIQKENTLFSIITFVYILPVKPRLQKI